jgi:hypothetical protein
LEQEARQDREEGLSDLGVDGRVVRHWLFLLAFIDPCNFLVK